MCNMDKRLLYSYADNSIEPLEKIILEEHLKYCKECAQELIEIRNMEGKLAAFDFEDIEIPQRLSDLSELIIDNCLNEVEKEKPKITYNNYKESIRLMKSTILDGYKLRYNNPYDKLIKKNIAITTNIVKKSAGRYCQSKFENSKLAKSKLCKILKAV